MKTVIYLLLACAVPCSGAQPLPVSDPHNAGGWVINEPVSDEFDGTTLDLEKWKNLGLNGDFYGEWKGRAPSQYNPANVSVGGGFLTIACKWEPGFSFADAKGSNGISYGKPAPVTTAAIITKARFKYGYLEMRCKAADGPVSSSFWTTGNGGEIDVFEHFGHNPGKPYSDSRFHASFHDWRKGSPTIGKRIWTNDHQLDFRVADDFHVYGVEWAETFVKVFVDGRMVNCVTKEEMGDKWVATNEQKVWIDSETFDWEVKPDALKAADFGDGRKFIVDYCRIWQRTGGSTACEPRLNLIANPGFEADLESWTGPATMADKPRSGQQAALVAAKTQIEQSVTVKPNTTYILSAWVKSPAADISKVWINCKLGVRIVGREERTTQFFLPSLHCKSLQFTTGPTDRTAVIFFHNQSPNLRAVADDISLVEAAKP